MATPTNRPYCARHGQYAPPSCPLCMVDRWHVLAAGEELRDVQRRLDQALSKQDAEIAQFSRQARPKTGGFTS